MDNYQSYVHKSRYARYLPELQRRETWEETVDRYVGFFSDKLDAKTQERVRTAILNMDVMPSMRAMMTAGKALDRDNVAGFNCSYIPIDSPRSFDELMYILLCGTGVGFSVERQYITKLPEVSEDFHPTDTVIHVADSKIGWAKAFRELISLLYSGQVPTWDTSTIRPAGAPLKTFGGRASGPEPLLELFKFTVELFKEAAGRKLNSIECHDLCCKVAQVVVVGGVRRSALISLSNLTDDRLRRAKHGQWWLDEPQRALANNSVCYTEKPDFEAFMNEWVALYESKSGERGMFSRIASQKQAAKNGRRDADRDFGTNPCSEIILRPYQFCNLSEVVVRPEDTLETLQEKVEIASILGTLQSTLTNFRYLRKVWKNNTEEECLLGVSLTGILDHPVMSKESEALATVLTQLKESAIDTNKKWAKKLGVNQSTAITCVKPSGTVSQLVDSASGIHGRFAPYYIRRVRADARDPLCQVLQDAGVPSEVDVTSPTTMVFSFPKKAPEGSVMASEQSGMDQLRLWKIYQDHWCEHKPSITVYYKDEEFLEIGNWLYNNFDDVSGVSFLPYSEHTYDQAPYEAISKEAYEDMLKTFPTEFDWDIVEGTDVTEGAQSLACVGNTCEIV
jgi:ribonucleoside-diphosphate reductase alpha chain